MHKNVFTLTNLPRGTALSYFQLILFYVFLETIFHVALFLENHSIALQHFFTDVLGITRVTSQKKPFCSLCWESFLNIFGLFLGMPLSFLESCFPLYLVQILYRFFLYYCNSQCAKKTFAARIPLLGALGIISGPILVIFLHVLENFFHITVVVTKRKNALWLLLLLLCTMFLK